MYLLSGNVHIVPSYTNSVFYIAIKMYRTVVHVDVLSSASQTMVHSVHRLLPCCLHVKLLLCKKFTLCEVFNVHVLTNTLLVEIIKDNYILSSVVCLYFKKSKFVMDVSMRLQSVPYS